MQGHRRNEIIPKAKLFEVQDGSPRPEEKCKSCAGDGVITVFSVTTGEPLCTHICPTCGGTKYEP